MASSLALTADLTVGDAQFALALDALTRGSDVEFATLDVDVARVLILMVGGLTRRGVAAQVALDAVVAHAADGNGTTLHQEVLFAVDAVAHGLGDVQRQVLHADVVAALDGVLRVARHVQRALALQLQLSLAVDAGLLRAVATVGQRVLRAALGAELYALLVGDVDGGTVRVGHRQTCQRNGTFIRAVECQRAVGGRAAEHVGDLVAVDGLRVCLRDGDVCAAYFCRDVVGYVIGHRHRSR